MYEDTGDTKVGKELIYGLEVRKNANQSNCPDKMDKITWALLLLEVEYLLNDDNKQVLQCKIWGFEV